MRVLVLMGSYFPYGVAISSRIVNFCRLFHESGMTVHVISQYTKDKKMDIDTIQKMSCCTYQVATRKDSSSFASFFGEPSFIPCVDNYITEFGKPDVIFASGVEPYFNKLIARYNDIPIYLEQCEWMDKTSYRFGIIDFRFIRRNRLLSGGYKKSAGIVSISRLLDEHYQSLGIKSIRIPTILDVENTEYRTNKCNKKIILVYTGNPSTSKELFKPIFEAIKENKVIRNNVEFHIYGPTEEKVLANIDNDKDLYNQIRDVVYTHGRVPQEEMGEIIRAADYQIFVRPNRRSSNAGFPTKLAESMSVGTPVITNDTGDIGLYVENEINGFMLKGIEKDNVIETLLHVISISQEQQESIRRQARKTALMHFDFRGYKNILTQLIGK